MRPRRELRDGAAGAVSAEYVAVALVVASLVAALLVLGLPGTVGVWGEFARCTLFGDDCARPQAYDPGSCVTSTSSGRVRVEGAALVFEAARELGYDTHLHSDGTVEVTYRTSDTGGVGAGAGVSVRLSWDDLSADAGAEWSASATATFEEGQTWRFDGDDAATEAAQWIAWHRANTGGADLAVPGGRDSLLGDLYGLGHEAVNGLLDLLPGVDGQDRPSTPAVTATYHEAGAAGEVGGLIGAGDTGAGGDQNVELFAQGSLGIDRALGVRLDATTGTTTAYLDLSSMAEGDLAGGYGGDGLGWALTAGDQSVMELTWDRDGNLVSSSVITYRLDEAGLQLAGTTDPTGAFGDSAFAQATASGDVDDQPDPSLYEVRAHVDLTGDDRDALLTALGTAAGLQAVAMPPNQAARDLILDGYYDAANITVTEREIDERAWGGTVNAGALIEAGGGAMLSSSEERVVGAHYYDPLQGQYVPWSSCTEAAG